VRKSDGKLANFRYEKIIPVKDLSPSLINDPGIDTTASHPSCGHQPKIYQTIIEEVLGSQSAHPAGPAPTINTSTLECPSAMARILNADILE
jgi:hypothetical protein